MSDSKLDESYWPGPLHQLASEQPLHLQEPYIVVAEISEPWGPKSYRQIYTALISPELKESVLSIPGGIGHEVTTTGPHPSPYKGLFDYTPGFSIWAGELAPEGLEPLVVAWVCGSRTVLLPDQGFLMTYGLIPRAVRSDDGDLIHWDDLQKPQYDVVIAKMVSEYLYELKTEAFIKIDRQYLQDYATVRNKFLVQTYYATNSDQISEDDSKALSGKGMQEFRFPGRLLDIRLAGGNGNKLMAQVWGVRNLLGPLSAPICGGRWEYGQLMWPGIDGPVTALGAKQSSREYVYVSDSVLQYYEDRPNEFSICPELGSVSFQGQWSVGHCDRIYRDIIRLEIRKLYESCPPHVVEHWNKHAIAPPPQKPFDLMQAPNCASRTKKIVYALCDLGETLAEISTRATGRDLEPKNFTGLDREALDYNGWWSMPSTSSLAMHIPLDMGEKAFLDRCKELYSFIVEGMNEGHLRRILVSSGVNDSEIKKLKALKLLDILTQHALIGIETGLSCFKHTKDIETLRLEKISRLETGQHLGSPISSLFILNDLRNAAAHAGKTIKELLVSLGSDVQSVRAGYGLLLDMFYDSIANALTKTTQVLRDAYAADLGPKIER